MLNISIKQALRTALSFLGMTLIAASTPVLAQNTFPNKSIRLIVPFAPGGVTDTSGRLSADQVSRRIGQSIIVENKAGASGNIGAAMVAPGRAVPAHRQGGLDRDPRPGGGVGTLRRH